MRRVLVIVAAAAVVPVLGACGGTTSGTATTSTSSPQAAIWNPCTQIPDDLLRQLGVDPATEEIGVAGQRQSGWEICGWKGATHYLTVFSTGRTVQEIREKPGNVDFTEVSVGGRAGVRYRVEGASKKLTCDIAFAAAQGSISVMISNNPVADSPEDPCQIAQRSAAQLVPLFPQ
ncbi:DUF3558 domain-containing protein [Nocardia farcinica]